MAENISIKVKFIPEGFEKIQGGMEKIAKKTERVMETHRSIMKNAIAMLGRNVMGALPFGIGGAIKNIKESIPKISGEKGGGFLGIGMKGIGLLGAIAFGIGIIMKGVSAMVGFLMNLAPIKAVMELLRAFLTLFFMPVAMMIMGLLAPFLIYMLGIFRAVNLPTILKSIMKGTGEISGFLGGLAGFIRSNIFKIMMGLKEGILALVVLLAGIGYIFAGLMVFLNAYVRFWRSVGRGIHVVVILISSALGYIYTAIVKYFSPIAGIMGKIYSGIVDGLKPIFMTVSGILGKIFGIFSDIWGFINGAFGTLINDVEGIIKAINGVLHFQHGGEVPKTTLAVVHAGEYVVPRGKMIAMGHGGGNINVNVSVNANVSNDIDMRKLADIISAEIENKIRRVRGW